MSSKKFYIPRSTCVWSLNIESYCKAKFSFGSRDTMFLLWEWTFLSPCPHKCRMVELMDFWCQVQFSWESFCKWQAKFPKHSAVAAVFCVIGLYTSTHAFLQSLLHTVVYKCNQFGGFSLSRGSPTPWGPSVIWSWDFSAFLILCCFLYLSYTCQTSNWMPHVSFCPRASFLSWDAYCPVVWSLGAASSKL